MARRRHKEEHGNHEAWAIPYGDLITLLLAFFVVMYSISSVNEGKYRVLSDSLVAAFRAAPRSLDPVQMGEMSRGRNEIQTRQPRTLVPLEIDAPVYEQIEEGDGEIVGRPLEIEYLQRSGFLPSELDAAAALIQDINEALTEALGSLVEQDLVRVRRDRFWIEVEINTSVLFGSGSAELSPESLPVVHRIGEILTGAAVRVYVEGHTDELPIATRVYPSNWELSAARAARVVRLFADVGVRPETMAVVGFGEFQPAADNETAAGRQRNRRVAIVIMAGRERVTDQPTLEALGLAQSARSSTGAGP